MRHATLSIGLAFVMACEKGPSPSPSPSPPPPPPPPTPVPVVPGDASLADATAPLVKLWPKLPPLGLRAGAWLDIKELAGAHISELRVTAPRVAKFAIRIDGLDPVIVAHDPSSREAQVISIDANGSVRIAIAELRPAKSGQRARVATIEAWGRPSGDPEATPSVFASDGPDGPCPDLDRRNAKFAAEQRRSLAACQGYPYCGMDEPGEAVCRLEPLETGALPDPWRDATLFCSVDDFVFGPSTCTVAVSTPAGSELAVFPQQMPGPESLVVETRVADIVVGGAPELVFAYKTDYSVDSPRQVVICQADPLACTAPRVEAEALSQPLVFR